MICLDSYDTYYYAVETHYYQENNRLKHLKKSYQYMDNFPLSLKFLI